MVDKTIIEFHQRTKSYTVPDFSQDTVLVEQRQGTDEDATQIPPKTWKSYWRNSASEWTTWSYWQQYNWNVW